MKLRYLNNGTDFTVPLAITQNVCDLQPIYKV